MKISNGTGLTAEILENGAVGWFDAAPVMISLRRASVYSGAYAGVWLRIRGDKMMFRPLTGPGSCSRFRADGDSFYASGTWEGIAFECCLNLSGKSLSWEWRIALRNGSGRDVELDLVCMQDAGLKTLSSDPANEYYVSQYTERRILDDPAHGKVVLCRQNMQESVGNPWLMIASGGRAASACTDGMQFYGRSHRATGIPEGLQAGSLGGEYAGESSVVALQEEPFILSPGKSRIVRFAATFLHNHPHASSEADLGRLQGLFREFDDRGGNAGVEGDSFFKNRGIIFSLPDLLQAEELDEGELRYFFPGEWRHPESGDGKILSFFYGDNRHVMLHSKEIIVDRPHGHIMHTRSHLVPDDSIMSTTAFASGVFNSHLTQGNTNFNTLLSVCNSQFDLNRVTGQRIFVVAGGRRMLLGVPSAFEMGINHCRWIYRHGSSVYQVRTWTSGQVFQVNTEFVVLKGEQVSLLVTHDFDRLNGWTVRAGSVRGRFITHPAAGSMITGKYPDARFIITVQGSGTGYRTGSTALAGNERGNDDPDLFILETDPISRFCISFTGCVVGDSAPVLFEDPERQFISDISDAGAEWKAMSRALTLDSTNSDIKAIREILPWFGMNAVTHFLTPYGLEQFSGAAWGTRDISQGPVELLLSMGRYAEARKVLEVIFSNQEPDGGWPQWWMFDRYNDIRADSAHGDVVYWCLIAASSYIRATGDFDFLDALLPFHQTGKTSETDSFSLRDHIDRLVKKVTDSFIPGKALVSYGGGDWNDSLQPVSRELADRLISSWTVEMNYQAFMQYAEVCSASGDRAKAAEMHDYCAMIRNDFNNFLTGDGVVAGYGLAGDDGTISLLLHPFDSTTGIRYSLLPMERGIVSGIFTAVQAEHHLDIIEKFLKGPDGARLMDRPLGYSGGIQKIFRRAESSTYFGREIGLMYIHEHIRYAEALARTGRADAFLGALRQAIPVGYRDIVKCADIRQSNCYYSSSDAVFENRYQADAKYHDITEGRITLRGGWRVYSSGPGIFTGIIMTHLLGIRREWGKYIIDPVLPDALDGLTAALEVSGRIVTFRYHVKGGNCGPVKITVNGEELAFIRASDAYRAGGAIVDEDVFTNLPPEGQNEVEIYL